jgi:peroxiredoxin
MRVGTDAAARAAPSPVLLDPQGLERILAWVGTTPTRLEVRLQRLRDELRRSLAPEQRAALAAVLERLRMLQVVEHGLTVGDTLPDFALRDTIGRRVASGSLLAQGPLVLAFIRGTWCPYCSLALQALDEEVLPEIERLGASLVVVSPLRPTVLARAAAARGLRLRLLSDADGAYARVCGVQYEMSEAQVTLYRGFGLDLEVLNAGSGWSLPVPATYVAGRDGALAFAYGDADWARRAEPAVIVGAAAGLVREQGG